MNVGILTFHASHNYGSMLQTFALQQTVMKFGHNCEIINFRTDRQKLFYRPFYSKTWKSKIKACIYPSLALNDHKKYRLFEQFLTENYTLSHLEYATDDELKDADFPYDAYISGSDQIWNTDCFDFDWAYYLDFVKTGRRIAYAPSMGPVAEKSINPKNFANIAKALKKYSHIAVREEGTADMVERISGERPITVLDPTLLPDQKLWNTMGGTEALIKGDYLLLYTPWYSYSLYEQAAELAELYNLTIIATINQGNRTWRTNPRFRFFNCVGPLEFLNLMKFSKMVCSESFHAVVFAIIFGKPFYAKGGMSDNRIAPILRISALEECAELETSRNIDFSDNKYISAFSKLDKERNNSIEYLKNSLS